MFSMKGMSLMKNDLSKSDLSAALELIALLKELETEDREIMLNMIKGYGLAKGADIKLYKPGKTA